MKNCLGNKAYLMFLYSKSSKIQLVYNFYCFDAVLVMKKYYFYKSYR